MAGVVAILCGLAIAITPFAFSLNGNANGGERVTDRFRSTLSTDGLQALQSSFGTVVAMGDQLFGRTLPDVRRELHESPAQFRAELSRRYPAIADAQRQVPPVIGLVQPKVPGLLALHKDFQTVDSIPFLGLPISSVPWLLLGIGVVVAGLGVAVLAWPTFAAAGLVAVAGLALIVVPIAVSANAKVNAADHLDKAGRFVFSPKIAPAALATTQRIDRMVDEVKTSFIPQTAARLHEPPARLNAQIARRYPAVATGLAAWPSIRPGALHRAHDQVASQADFANLDDIHFAALPWTVMGPGILMLLVGGAALAQRRALARREPAPVAT
jgi:uncharacterized membrane protein YphA (DoxX/SURF4 family)